MKMDNRPTPTPPDTFVSEPTRKLPVDATYDVAVAGAGIAGVAAALAAVRQGLSVVLIEKQFGLGGLATLGHVIKYLPLCDGYGKQVMGGIAEELLHHSVAELTKPMPSAAFVPLDDCWKNEDNLPKRLRKRLMTSFNPYAFQMQMEQVLGEAGVTLMYDTRVCQVLKSGKALTHLIVENKSGRLALKADAFVDASGDADLAWLADCAVERFTHNVLACWHYEIKNGKLCLAMFSNPYDPEHRDGGKATGPFFSGTDHRDVTEQVLASHRLLLERLRQKQEKAPESTIYPFALPSIPDFRVTRCLRNAFTIRESHRHQWLEDCVGITGDWRKRGPIYPIPLRALLADSCTNLFVAGRCISSDQSVVDVTRAIGTCAVSGQASGTAAAMMVKDRLTDAHELPVDKLQQRLRNDGALIHPDLLKAHPRAKAK
ncbi:FAD-dependent oxidoreductase [Ruficoccus sp. ZRK36]|uniref:FAD-dependent oxidoreductase n=1 Tax=Ruficoccus sp. ZRK36 TaxID=2866311 RepID=UPI001C734E42|nr:FAD-dependent oxidoreductase [Ruficoccus sp. ZRK36]QYY35083.1 FAD-dependent oxidoreductase [Ruficoccus sp. ZRK36]